MAIIVIIIITAVKRSQQSIYSLYVQYNVIILLGHNITDNVVNTQKNEAYDVIRQFKMKIVRNVSYEDVTTHVNRAPDYVNVRNNNDRILFQ